MSFFPSEDALSNWLQARFLGFEPKVLIGPDFTVYFVVPSEAWDMLPPNSERCWHDFDWVQTGQWTCRVCGFMVVSLYYENDGELRKQSIIPPSHVRS